MEHSCPRGIVGRVLLRAQWSTPCAVAPDSNPCCHVVASPVVTLSCIPGSIDVLCASPAAGKAFFRKKKQPVPVDLRGRDWGAQIERACAATYLHLAPGTSVCVRRGLPYLCTPCTQVLLNHKPARRCSRWVWQMLNFPGQECGAKKN